MREENMTSIVLENITRIADTPELQRWQSMLILNMVWVTISQRDIHRASKIFSILEGQD